MGATLRLAGAAAAVLVVAACGPTNSEPTTTSASRGLPASAATRTLTAETAVVAAQAVRESQATVTRVVDGDTFETVGGQQVRLLGVDSCEMGTRGGSLAKAEAEKIFNRAHTVMLKAEPTGDDKDHLGRLLRYVTVDGQDFGVQMVQWDHTGIYASRHDASQEYVNTLYQHDTKHSANPPSGRECGSSVAAPAPRTSAPQAPRTTAPQEPADKGDAAPRADTPSSGCHPSYEPCVPNSSRDLDCKDVGHRVRVVGPDEYRLDGDDNDGKGCESY